MLRTASYEDKSAILSLWKSCFGDTDEYIQLYLDHKFCPERTIILEIDNKIIGMTHLLPCKLYPDKKAFYWYAVCIDKDHRGNGYFRVMVEQILKETQKRGYSNLCVPAPGLESVYQKMGFEKKYLASDINFTIDNKNDHSITFLKARPHDFLLQNGGEGSTIWNLSDLEYAFLENEFSGGYQLKFQINEKEYFLFAIKKEDYYLIDYHNMTENIFFIIKDSLLNYLNCDRVQFRTLGRDKIVGLSDSILVNESSKITMNLG